MLKFTEDHEWLRLEDGIATVGVTEHAVEQLGDLVFIELPDAGSETAKGDEVVVIESVKAAADITAPAEGVIVEANAAVAEDPTLVNNDPMGAGWFFKLKLSDPSMIDTLMDEDAYKAMVG